MKQIFTERILQKLFFFSISSFALLSCTKNEVPPAPAPKQIVHKEINFELAYQHHLGVDLDQNGEYEFYFVSERVSDVNREWVYLAAIPEAGSEAKVLVQQGPDQGMLSNYWAKPITKGQQVSEPGEYGNYSWSDVQKVGYLLGTSVNGTLTSYKGPWAGKLNTYLAVKFLISGKYHYGWVSLTHPGWKQSILVEDYAYNKVPGEPLNAGEY